MRMVADAQPRADGGVVDREQRSGLTNRYEWSDGLDRLQAPKSDSPRVTWSSVPSTRYGRVVAVAMTPAFPVFRGVTRACGTLATILLIARNGNAVAERGIPPAILMHAAIGVSGDLMSSTSMDPDRCPAYNRAAEIIGRRWAGAIVRAMLGGAARFTDIRAAIPGIADRVLSRRLKELEADGILTRLVYPETPVRIEYRLTDKGRALGGVVDAISAWANDWAPTPSSRQ